MADPRLDRLEGILLTLLPVDGNKVPNGQLRPNWVQAAAAAGDLVTEAVFDAKGEDSPQNVAKRDALKLWVDAVNAKGGFGTWCWDVAFEPAQVHDIVRRHGATADAPLAALALS